MRRFRDIQWFLAVATILLSFTNMSVGAEPSVLVETRPVELKTFTKTLTAYGRTRPDPVAVQSINLPRSGIIARVWIRVGQLVAAGAPLLQFDTSPTASVQFQQAEAALEYARRNLRREEDLFRIQLATRDQVANARKKLADAEAQLREQRKLGTGQVSETIRAPFAGVVTKINVSQGDLIQAGSNTILLARRESLIVPLGVEPEDAVSIRPGMPVAISPVFQPNMAFSSDVSEVHAMINPATRLIDVLVRVKLPANADFPLGSTMKGVITLSKTESLGVPRSAVLSDRHGSWIFVAHGGRAHKVPVETGLQEAGMVAITGAVNPGDRVVVSGAYELKDGMAVRKGTP
jgi:membrane fusion protein (multidrug efflux system)